MGVVANRAGIGSALLRVVVRLPLAPVASAAWGDGSMARAEGRVLPCEVTAIAVERQITMPKLQSLVGFRAMTKRAAAEGTQSRVAVRGTDEARHLAWRGDRAMGGSERALFPFVAKQAAKVRPSIVAYRIDLVGMTKGTTSKRRAFPELMIGTEKGGNEARRGKQAMPRAVKSRDIGRVAHLTTERSSNWFDGRSQGTMAERALAESGSLRRRVRVGLGIGYQVGLRSEPMPGAKARVAPREVAGCAGEFSRGPEQRLERPCRSIVAQRTIAPARLCTWAVWVGGRIGYSRPPRLGGVAGSEGNSTRLLMAGRASGSWAFAKACSQGTGLLRMTKGALAPVRETCRSVGRTGCTRHHGLVGQTSVPRPKGGSELPLVAVRATEVRSEFLHLTGGGGVTVTAAPLGGEHT